MNEDKGKGNYGTSNFALAKFASEQDLPVIAQWEIARYMENEFQKLALRSVELEKGKDYIDSREVLLQVKKYMTELGFTSAILLAHPDHLLRVHLIAKKLGIKEGGKLYSEIPYDSKSSQPWTRNKMFFIAREIPTLAYFFLKGWI